MQNSILSSFVLLILSLLLASCGGDGTKDDSNQVNNEITNTPPVSNSTQPRAIEVENWQSARIIDPTSSIQNTVEIIGSQLHINISSTDLVQGAHLQIYINSDNKPETGFQFENQAWEESGVDFLIEDGDLFQSTQNNTGWNWNVNVGTIDYQIDTDSASAKIDLSLLGDICNNLKIGVMTRDEFWDIATFSPASSQMQNYSVSYCNTETVDTVNPVIGLLGANPINLTTGESFIDPGATALDNIDGDLTSSIFAESEVNTEIAGTYAINYSVTDTAGNSSSIARQVIVSDSVLPNGIVVDGNIDDWAEIPTFTSSADAVMLVTDDEDKLYILLTSNNLGENTQILMDTDNNATTGLKLSSQVNAWLGGADYMIENNSLDKSKSNTGWSWDYGIAPIEFIKTANILEISIKKSDLNNLSNEIPMGYVSRTTDWNANYVLPSQSLPSYNLKFPTEVNPVIANNDFFAVTNNAVFVIDVLDNDTSTSGSTLSIDSITQPNTGEASIVTNQVIYRPDTTFTGSVNFNYTVSDANNNSDTANIKVIVTAPINIPPIANDDSTTTSEGLNVSIDVLGNDTSNSGSDQLRITNVSNPFNGSVNIVNGQLIYSPNSGYSGIDEFNYTIIDSNGLTTVASVIVNVIIDNIRPVAQNDSITTPEQTPVTIDVLDNDTTYSGSGQLTITSVDNPSNGSATIVNGQVIYTPNPGFFGTDFFTYNIMDSDGETATARVTISIPIISNNNPPIAVEDFFTLDLGTQSSIIIDVLANDLDPENDSLTITSVTDTPLGNATILPDGRINYVPSGTIWRDLGFTYFISDGNGGTAQAILYIDIFDSTNSNPVAVTDSITTIQDQSVNFNVLTNDIDAEGDQITITSGISSGINSNGSIISNGNGNYTYTPNQGFTGLDSFSYGISDGRTGRSRGNVNITVNPRPNSPPVAVDDNVTTIGINTLRIRIRDNDFDPDNNGIELTNDYTQPSNGIVARNTPSTLDYTPDPTFTGIDSFTYTIKDSSGATATATVFVTVPNKDPIAGDDIADKFSNQIITVNVLGNDIDTDGDTLSVQSIIQPSAGLATLNSNGTITFDPQNNVGNFNIIYNINDGRGGNDSGVLTVRTTIPR